MKILSPCPFPLALSDMVPHISLFSFYCYYSFSTLFLYSSFFCFFLNFCMSSFFSSTLSHFLHTYPSPTLTPSLAILPPRRSVPAPCNARSLLPPTLPPSTSALPTLSNKHHPSQDRGSRHHRRAQQRLRNTKGPRPLMFPLSRPLPPLLLLLLLPFFAYILLS